MNMKQRARDLLTADLISKYPMPEEVQQFLRDFVALEPVASRAINALNTDYWVYRSDQTFGRKLYEFGEDHDPA